jgi:VWFA-related protein
MRTGHTRSLSTASVVALLFSAAQAFPQQTPAPTQPAAKAQPSGVTLRAQTQLVVVDVVVTDRNHQPVHGLKASDFALTENNGAQVVKHFEEHTALTPADATRFPHVPKLAPGVFTNYTPEPVNGTVNLLLLDSLNTPMRDQAYVRAQLLAYLKSVPPGTRIAIFGLTSRLVILQGFTSDPEVLRNLMAKGVAKGSPLLDDSVGGSGTQNSTADDLEDLGTTPDIVANVRQFEAEQKSYQLQLRTKLTLEAMNEIGHYLAGIPGRKNLIWFSGSFPINIMPDMTGELPNPFAVMASSEDEFRETVKLLARNQVAVYPIDARGLQTSPVFEASSSRNYTRGPSRMIDDQNKFTNDLAQEHSAMREMADATGGHAFVNTNGLTQAVAAAINEGSNFYTLIYTPTNTASDGKLRKIKVQLDRPGVSLAYRRGYYADSPRKAPAAGGAQPAAVSSAASAGNATGSATPNAANARDALRVAMTRGAPTPAEILLKIGVFPAGPPTKLEDTVAAGNVASPKAHGPYRRYTVDYGIAPGDVTFLRTAEGKAHAELDLVIHVYEPDGTLVNSLGSGVRMTLPIEDIRKKFATGIHFHQEISAPAKGEYFLRIAVHDLSSDHYGAVEVATSSVRKLTAPTPPAAAPPANAPAPTSPAPASPAPVSTAPPS